MKKKILFYNISGVIHSNDISEIFILFQYFRNMYPCHMSLSRTSVKISFSQMTSSTSQKYNRSIVILPRTLLRIFGKCDEELKWYDKLQ